MSRWKRSLLISSTINWNFSFHFGFNVCSCTLVALISFAGILRSSSNLSTVFRFFFEFFRRLNDPANRCDTPPCFYVNIYIMQIWTTTVILTLISDASVRSASDESTSSTAESGDNSSLRRLPGMTPIMQNGSLNPEICKHLILFATINITICIFGNQIACLNHAHIKQNNGRFFCFSLSLQTCMLIIIDTKCLLYISTHVLFKWRM